MIESLYITTSQEYYYTVKCHLSIENYDKLLDCGVQYQYASRTVCAYAKFFGKYLGVTLCAY